MIGMISIYERPVDVLGPEFPGHWEGDLIKGAGNASGITLTVHLISCRLEDELVSRRTWLAVWRFSDAQNLAETSYGRVPLWAV
ncbi:MULTISPECIES: hypothetical protein [unclassified Bradyrhizobium]|nr:MULTISPECIES: hypothetical protein [unclassified Bradyrhizobium]